MFATMRTAIGMQRALDNAPSVDTGEVLERISLTCADVVQFATIDGAHAAGLADTTGSIAVGKAADIVVLDDRSLALTPLNNPIGSLVYSAHPGLVRDVFVQGRGSRRTASSSASTSPAEGGCRASRSYLLGEMPEARLDGTWHPALVTA